MTTSLLEQHGKFGEHRIGGHSVKSWRGQPDGRAGRSFSTPKPKPAGTAEARATEMMKPYVGAIEAWEVGAEVSNVKNNRPELMERVGLV